MAKRIAESSPLYQRIGFGFTAHPITVWAGVILLRLYFEWIKLREELSEALVGFAKHSNNQIPSVDVCWRRRDETVFSGLLGGDV